MSFIVLDIETIVDPALPAYQPKPGGNDFPPVPHWSVVCIGAALLDDACVVDRIGLVNEVHGEAAKVQGLVALLASRRPCVVGVNSRGFDLPVVAARCVRYGIAFPWYYEPPKKQDPRYRFGTETHLDLLDYLGGFGAVRSNGGLDVWARLCGFPGKRGTTGADVDELHAAGEHERIGSYCMEDVATTCALLMRVQMVRGLLSREAYGAAATSLLSLLEREPRLAELGAGVDRPRFLLTT
jgi:predicted PolB exonuclease-like 3'-5' exonuclease